MQEEAWPNESGALGCDHSRGCPWSRRGCLLRREGKHAQPASEFLSVTCTAEAALLGRAHACPTEWEGPTPFKRERADKLLQLATTLDEMTEDWGPHFHTSELHLRCGSWSTYTPAQQWCVGGWAQLPRHMFQHRGTPAMYTLGTCPTRRGAC